MSRPFYESTDAALLAGGTNFSTLITATPTAFGLTAANATAYAASLATYSAALAASTDPSTRGGATVLAKNTARVNLVALTRQLARTVQGTASVTNEQRYYLGLSLRNQTVSPIPVPGHAPDIVILKTVGRTVSIRMIDPENPTRRGKPPGVAGMAVFSHIGATPPPAVSDWTFQGNTTRTLVNVSFEPTVADGAKIWLTAFYFNPRSQSGPACDPVSVNLPGGSVSLMAA